ncbi:MAG: GNAT family N-acetyltransferase [Bacteriovorax sp.]
MTIEGQEAYSSDLAFVLFELDQSFFPTPWNFESWSHLFVDHNRLLLVMQDQDRVIGFCLFDLSDADSFAHLLKVLIHPDYRNQRLSKVVLEKAVNHLESKAYKEFFLEVEESNLAAQSLYQSLGFIKIHRKKDFYGSGRAALIMTKGQSPS